MMKSNARHLVPALLLEGESQEMPNRENRDLGAELRMEFEFRKHRFIKRYTLAAIFIAALIVWTVVSCSITAAIVRKNTTKEVTQRVEAEMRNSFQNYLDQKEENKKKENFLTGTESFDAAVDAMVGPMSQILSCYAQEYGITTEGLYTIGWSFCARCAQNSTEFGKTPQEILEKKGAWEGDVVGHATRNREEEIAKEVATDYLSGKYPDGYTTAMTFFNREAGGKIIARNELYTGPHTIYWWYGK